MSENYFPEMLHLALKSPISGKYLGADYANLSIYELCRVDYSFICNTFRQNNVQNTRKKNLENAHRYVLRLIRQSLLKTLLMLFVQLCRAQAIKGGNRS